MAALQKIRSKSGLLIGIIAAGLLAFVLPWNEITMGINKSRDKAFTVDGEVVSTQQYSERILQWENFQKTVTGESSLREDISSLIRELTYQQMATEIMLDKQAEKLGLKVTPAEINDIANNPNFGFVLQRLRVFINPMTGQLDGVGSLFANQQTNQFDREGFTHFLNDVKTPVTADMPAQLRQNLLMRQEMWAFIEHALKYQLLQDKYSALVAGTFIPNSTDAKATFNDSKTQANIAYVVQRYSSVADSAVVSSVTDKDIKALYDKRKNNYKLDTELRKISYFIKDVIPSDDDFTAVEKDMESAYEKLLTAENPALLVSEYSTVPYTDAFISVSSLQLDMKNFVESSSVGQVKAPERTGQSYVMYKLVDRTTAADSIKVRIIPLPQGLDSKDAAHISDSLLNVVKGGKDFATLADETMPGSSSVWVTEMMIAGAGSDFVKKCFGASKGEILNITSNGQTQLVHVEDKTSPVAKVKLAVIQMPVIVSDRTQNSIDNELNQFVSESGNMADFDKAAQTKGYSIIPNAIISPAEMALGQATGSRQVIHWAFNEKKGSVKKFDLTDKRIVAIIKDEIKGDYMPVSEVATELRSELIKEKKAEKIIGDLKAKNLTSLDAYAQAIEGRVDTANFVTFQTNNITGGIGYEPIMNVYAKHGQVNKLEQPVKGNAGVYVINVLEKTENTNEFDPVQAKQMSVQNSYYQLMSQAMYVLKNKMNVKDNRVRFW